MCIEADMTIYDLTKLCIQVFFFRCAYLAKRQICHHTVGAEARVADDGGHRVQGRVHEGEALAGSRQEPPHVAEVPRCMNGQRDGWTKGWIPYWIECRVIVHAREVVWQIRKEVSFFCQNVLEKQIWGFIASMIDCFIE